MAKGAMLPYNCCMHSTGQPLPPNYPQAGEAEIPQPAQSTAPQRYHASAIGSEPPVICSPFPRAGEELQRSTRSRLVTKDLPTDARGPCTGRRARPGPCKSIGRATHHPTRRTDIRGSEAIRRFRDPRLCTGLDACRRPANEALVASGACCSRMQPARDAAHLRSPYRQQTFARIYSLWRRDTKCST